MTIIKIAKKIKKKGINLLPFAPHTLWHYKIELNSALKESKSLHLVKQEENSEFYSKFMQSEFV